MKIDISARIARYVSVKKLHNQRVYRSNIDFEKATETLETLAKLGGRDGLVQSFNPGEKGQITFQLKMLPRMRIQITRKGYLKVHGESAFQDKTIIDALTAMLSPSQQEEFFFKLKNFTPGDGELQDLTSKMITAVLYNPNLTREFKIVKNELKMLRKKAFPDVCEQDFRKIIKDWLPRLGILYTRNKIKSREAETWVVKQLASAIDEIFSLHLQGESQNQLRLRLSDSKMSMQGKEFFK